MTKRFCVANGCDIRVPSDMVFCHDHWVQVPDHCRQKLFDAFRPGQFETGDVSAAWDRAVRVCISTIKENQLRGRVAHV